MVVRRRLWSAALLLLAAVPLRAELGLAGEIDVLTGALRLAEKFHFYGVVTGKLSIQAVSKEVKGLLELDASVVPGAVPEVIFDLPRAYIKARFPWFRLAAGKTRLSWGSGFLFNAGDVIFGAMSPQIDLTVADPRDRTAWMCSVYVPVAELSLVEAVVLPYMPPPAGSVVPGVPAPEAPFVPFDSVNGGARAVFGLPGLIMEAGYLFDGADNLHKPYVSIQGSLFFDAYAAAGISVPAAAQSWDTVKQSLELSCGLSRIFPLEGRGNLSVRAEAGFIPCGQWREEPGGLPSGGLRYGAMIFPEIAYSPSDAFSVLFRSLISPVDASALGLVSLVWKAYQGFQISLSVYGMFGEPEDVFGWGDSGDVGLLLSLEHVF